jgi:GNAT superfamily N-acetyltransferase
MGLSITPYSDADFEAATVIWFDSAKSMGVPMPFTLGDLRDRWPKELANGWIVYVAKLDLNPAGFIAMKEGKLDQLFIAPKYQCRGIGKALLNLAKRDMPNGFYLTAAILGRACQFYEREGLERGETSLHRFGHEIVRFDWKP